MPLAKELLPQQHLRWTAKQSSCTAWLPQLWEGRGCPSAFPPPVHLVEPLRLITVHFENHKAHWSLRSLPAARSMISKPGMAAEEWGGAGGNEKQFFFSVSFIYLP